MRRYELMLVMRPDTPDEQVDAVVDKATRSVTTSGGQIVKRSPWGRRRLAYPIKKRWDGWYVFFNVLAEGGALDEVERSLRIADNVFRHMLLRLPDAEAARRGMTEAA